MKDENKYYKKLISKIINDNEKKAFHEFYDLFYNKLVGYALKITGSKEDSEDIVSVLFLDFLQKKELYLKIERIESYLYYSVRNACIKVLNRNKKLEQGDLFERIHIDNSTPLSIIEFNELCKTVERAIESLPPKRKQVFLLIRDEGLKYKEVAEKLNISVKTIENQMTKAIASLRENIESALTNEDTIVKVDSGINLNILLSHAMLILST
uniref:RNA polymerase sigma factor n=1 Tax=uncultured Draconibacterium sp. TaxID=1573823 RepID=UPI0032174CFD